MTGHAENWKVHPGALEPGTKVGSWRVMERLGTGGHGAVYRVEAMACPGVFHALKLALNPGDERAEREVQLLKSQGVHPNVVRLHDAGRWPDAKAGYRYFVMDWVPGLALHTWAETRNPSFRQLAEKAGKVAQALGALHDRGVLHRDFKPEHVIIREKDGEPILLDFGVGRFVGADTVTSTVLPPATLHLLSPEAVRFFRAHSERPGARYEARATDDLYALGVCLYRVATGSWPFPPEQPANFLYVQIEAMLPAEAGAVNRRVPRALSDVIMRLLSKTPEARYQSGHEVHAALVAAEDIGGLEAWTRSLFEWEAGPGAADTPGGPARRIRRPEPATVPCSSPHNGEGLEPAHPPLPERRLERPQVAPRGAERAPGNRLMGRGRAYALVCVAAVVGATVAAMVTGIWPRQADAPTQPATSVGNEVAQEVKSPETASAAAPLQADSTPAAVDVPATPAEVQPAVKMPKTAVSPTVPTRSTQVKRLGSVGQACCVAVTCATLACAGEAPVRRGEPPSESCPPGSEEAMNQLRIFMGMDAGATFLGRPGEVISVREGSTEQELVGPLGKLPDRTRLMGRLLFGNGRVYGRITEARTSGNETFPVCLELLGEDLKPGLVQKPGGGADTVRVFSSNLIRPVRRFE